jgi:hypothetical protein
MDPNTHGILHIIVVKGGIIKRYSSGCCVEPPLRDQGTVPSAAGRVVCCGVMAEPLAQELLQPKGDFFYQT